jgi:hypothetical protein
MPLRDHYRLPVWKKASWEGFHSCWPTSMCRQLVDRLPPSFVLEPRVDLGPFFELDLSRFDGGDAAGRDMTDNAGILYGGAVTPVAAPPTQTIETDLPAQYAYEVRIFDLERDRRLVAAVEIVSPGNKDRCESRRALVAKTAALLEQGVCVSFVDLVTVRHFNLYADLLALIDRTDPAVSAQPAPTYAVTCRGRTGEEHRPPIDVWYIPLTVGQPLPELPLWLTDDIGVTLDLEVSYEETCRTLRIA